MRVIRNIRHRLPIACRIGRWSFFAALVAIPLNCWGQTGAPGVTLEVRTGPAVSARLIEHRPPASGEHRDKMSLVVAPSATPAEGSAKGVKSTAKGAPAVDASIKVIAARPKPAEKSQDRADSAAVSAATQRVSGGQDARAPHLGMVSKSPAVTAAATVAGALPKETAPLKEKEIAQQPKPTKTVPLAETPRPSLKPTPATTTVAENRPSPPKPNFTPAAPSASPPAAAKPNPAAVASRESPVVSAKLHPVETARPKAPVSSPQPTTSVDIATASAPRPERMSLVISGPTPPRETVAAAERPAPVGYSTPHAPREDSVTRLAASSAERGVTSTKGPAEVAAPPPVAYARLNEIPDDPRPRAMELIAVEARPVRAYSRPVGIPVGMVALQGPPPNPRLQTLERIRGAEQPPSVPLTQPIPAVDQPPTPPAPVPGTPPPPTAPPIERIPAERPPLSPQPYALEMAPVESPPLVDSPAATPYPLCYRTRCGVYCNGDERQHLTWRSMYPIPWEAFAQGEYVGPPRLAHVPEYRLRVDDQLDFVYIFSVRPSMRPYRLSVRDRVRVGSLTAPESVDLDVFVQPDGMVTLRLLGQIRVVGLTLEELRQKLEERYQQYVRRPAITITPVELNSPLLELRASVDRRAGAGGQVSQARVTPEGTVQLPVIGSVPVQGLSLPELKREIEARYEAVAEGIEVTPILVARAPRFFFVVGEVRLPGRFTMEGPTTALQAIAMAGSWNVGAHLEHVVVLRRDENWCLMATKLNLRPQLFGHKPCNGDEIWLRDSDIVIVPKSPLLAADDLIDLVFTRGIYRVVPFTTNLNFAKLSTL